MKFLTDIIPPRTMILYAIVAFVSLLAAVGIFPQEAPLLLFGMTVLTEANRLNSILKWEEDNFQSREQVTLLSGQNLSVGAVLGKITLGTCPSTGTAGTNSGSGTCTTVTAGQKAKLGVYTLKCIIAQSGAGIFSVKDPDGFALPAAIVGTAYTNDQINFTINDGSPDFSVGDSFTITIPEGSLKVRAINFNGIDGSQNAYGMLAVATDASLADKETAAIVREAQVIEANLVWPVTSPAVSASQKAAAMAQLKDKGIVSRVAV